MVCALSWFDGACWRCLESKGFEPDLLNDVIG